MVLVTPNRTGSSLRLYPWRDGFRTTKQLLEDKDVVDQVKTVHVIFEEKEFEHVLEDQDTVALFELMGNALLRLESVVIKLDVSPQFPLPSVTHPPILALTSLLLGENGNRIQFLTLIGLRLLGDDYDTNGLSEALRIHPTLHSFAMKDCWFSRYEHLETLKSALGRRQKRMKHCDLMDNVVVDIPLSKPNCYYNNGESEQTAHPFWESPMFLRCLYPVTCCL
jgi:hypothetical protein